MKSKKTPYPEVETLELYIYDYGYDKALELLHINSKIAEKIQHPIKKKQYKYNTVVDKPLHKNSKQIASILAKHYPDLIKEYSSYYKDTVYMSQTVEDFLLKAFIRCLEVGLEEVTDKAVLELFRIQFNTIRYYARLSLFCNNSSFTPLEIQNDEGEYIIPSEIYNRNAILE